MNVKAIAELTGLTPKAVRFFEKKGILTDPLQEEQIYFMQTISQIWKCTELIKMMLAHMNPAQRARLIFGAGHDELEQHIIYRFLHHYADRENNPYNLDFRVVVDEVMGQYSIPPSKKATITAKVIKLRKKVNNMRQRYPNEFEIANRLTKIQQPKQKQKEDSAKKQKDYRGQCEILGYA